MARKFDPPPDAKTASLFFSPVSRRSEARRGPEDEDDEDDEDGDDCDGDDDDDALQCHRLSRRLAALCPRSATLGADGVARGRASRGLLLIPTDAMTRFIAESDRDPSLPLSQKNPRPSEGLTASRFR